MHTKALLQQSLMLVPSTTPLLRAYKVLQTMRRMIPMSQLSQALPALDLMGRLADLHALLAKHQQTAVRVAGQGTHSGKGTGQPYQAKIVCFMPSCASHHTINIVYSKQTGL